MSKGLGKWTDDNENQIKLNFEPKARSSQSYGVFKKENICVVCGSGENHIRFYIVPYVYRAGGPRCYKSHMSHDIVIVCGYCHLECEKHTQIRIRELEALCTPPGGYPNKFIQNKYLYHVRTCAIALRQWKNKMPQDKIEEYEQVVANFLQTASGEITIANLSIQDLEAAMNVEYQTENPHYIPPSDFVVDKIASTDDQIQVFVRTWRQHFIHSNYPKFMPRGWIVDHPVRCDEQ